MEYIIRPKYINEIKGFVDKPVIKILTGMRRVGKSTILTIIKDYILASVAKENKIYMNFESIEFSHIADSHDLVKHLSPILKSDRGKLYFFFDEVQLVKGWERVINGLRADLDCDIYITGSNSTIISGDLATMLAGRYVEFEIHPFTFDEFTEIFAGKNLDREVLFDKYIKIGGMPFLKYFDLDETISQKYLNDVYNTVLVKDVLNYNQVRDIDLFNRILSFVIQNVGKPFSANSISRYFKSENRDVSVDTILNYLQYCIKAFIIKKVQRYDVIGKRVLRVDEKYYLTDHGFRHAMGYSNTRDIEAVLENIVYVELLSRGYKVEIGRVKDKEIDFIATKGNEKSYYQVTYLMESESTREREFGVYKDVVDNYDKYVVSMDKVDFSQDGIIHKNIIDFLLGE